MSTQRYTTDNVVAGRLDPRAPATTTRQTGASPWWKRDWFWGLVLVLALVAAYQPVWFAGYIWDDNEHLTANPAIVGPLGFWDIWTSSKIADISPLTRSTFWLEHALWGLAPTPYHVVNVLMHGACAVMLWQVLRRLRVPGAWLGAALWALHPVQVESVAWISEMKNTESGLFFLFSIFFFLRWLEPGADSAKRGWNYAAMLVFAALAMACKSSTVILPAVLPLCAWWMEGRLRARHLLAAAPLLLLTLAAGAESVAAQGSVLSLSTDPHFVRTWPQRIIQAGEAPWFYLGKLLWPHPLMTIYPRWQIDGMDPIEYLPLIFLAGAMIVLWLYRNSWARPWFFAFTYFLIALLPVLGFFDNTLFVYSLVYDHLQYLASMGPLALAGAGVVWLMDRYVSRKTWLLPATGVVILLVFGLIDYQRAGVYQSKETLWTDAIAKNPNCWIGYNELGIALEQKGHIDEAIADYRKALAINENFADAYNDLGYALQKKGQLPEAATQLRLALQGNPTSVPAHNNLGNVLLKLGQLDEAIKEYRKTLRLMPYSAEAHCNLGVIYFQEGQFDEAIAEYQEALKYDPHNADLHKDLGEALIKKGRFDEAIAEYQAALDVTPNATDIRNDLGYALLQNGALDESIAEYQKTLSQNPNLADAHANLGVAYAKKGDLAKAIAQFEAALQINPKDSAAQDDLARAQALLRKPTASK